jgi:hypothetical protein
MAKAQIPQSEVRKDLTRPNSQSSSNNFSDLWSQPPDNRVIFGGIPCPEKCSYAVLEKGDLFVVLIVLTDLSNRFLSIALAVFKHKSAVRRVVASGSFSLQTPSAFRGTVPAQTSSASAGAGTLSSSPA